MSVVALPEVFTLVPRGRSMGLCFKVRNLLRNMSSSLSTLHVRDGDSYGTLQTIERGMSQSVSLCEPSSSVLVLWEAHSAQRRLRTAVAATRPSCPAIAGAPSLFSALSAAGWTPPLHASKWACWDDDAVAGLTRAGRSVDAGQAPHLRWSALAVAPTDADGRVDEAAIVIGRVYASSASVPCAPSGLTPNVPCIHLAHGESDAVLTHSVCALRTAGGEWTSCVLPAVEGLLRKHLGASEAWPALQYACDQACAELGQLPERSELPAVHQSADVTLPAYSVSSFHPSAVAAAQASTMAALECVEAAKTAAAAAMARSQAWLLAVSGP